jgi:hypothetical protein
MNASMGAKRWLAHTQYQYACMLLARGQPGDRDHVRTLLEAALGITHALGMHALEERAAGLLEYISSQPRGRRAHPRV